MLIVGGKSLYSLEFKEVVRCYRLLLMNMFSKDAGIGMDSSVVHSLDFIVTPALIVCAGLLCCLIVLVHQRLARNDQSAACIAHDLHCPSAKLILSNHGDEVVYANRQASEVLPIEYAHQSWAFQLPQIGEELSKFIHNHQEAAIEGVLWDSDLLPDLQQVLVYARSGQYQGKTCLFVTLYRDARRMSAYSQLASDLQRFTDAFNSLPNFVHFKDLDNRLLGCNRAWANFHGLTPEGVKGKRLSDVLTREELSAEEQLDQGVLQGNMAQRQGWVSLPSGEQRLLEMHSYPLLNQAQEVQGVMSISTDVTNWHNLNRKLEQENQQRINTEQMLEQQNNLIRTVFNSSLDPIGFFDSDGYLTGGNQPFAEMFGLNQEDIAGKRVQDVLPDGQGQRHWQENQLILATGEEKCYEELVLLADDRQVWYEVRKGPYDDESSGESGVILVARDVTERKQTEQQLADAIMQLEELSFVDALTQVANRRSFDEKLTQLWLTHRREQGPLSLILLDIDCFKQFNDNYGHQSGDVALRKVAEVISGTTKRSTDLVARYGGEEFAILLPQTEKEGASKVAGDLLASLKACAIEHEYSEVDAHLTISIGVATIVPQANMDYGDLIEAADMALYQAKRTGRNKFCVAPASEGGKVRHLPSDKAAIVAQA